MYSQKRYENMDDEKNDADQPDIKQKLKSLKCSKSLEKEKFNTEIFLWGKAIPRNMFPQNQDQLTPWKCDMLSTKQIWSISAARQGSHCFGIGKNDWCFVWGETKQIGALGLGNNSHSTSPFILKTLSKKRVKQTCCSAVHSLCITHDMIIYGWGSKLLTLLNINATSPIPLNYLNGRGLTELTASNTHSLAWNPNSIKIYSFGIIGAWLGLNDDDDDDIKKQSFGMIAFDSFISNNNKEYSIRFADCSSEYTLLILNNGYIGCCGINEHGRMSIGKHIHSSSKIIWNMELKDIISCSAGPFHAGFIDINGNVYTCGIGIDYRLGHGDENILWKPKMVKACNQLKISQIECVESRTFIVTTDGALIMWGKEPIYGRIHKQPFIYQYLSGYKIYKIVAAKDFNVAIGIKIKQQSILKQNIDNLSVDEMKPNQAMNITNNLIGNVLNEYHPKCIQEGNFVNNVFGNFVGLKQVKYNNNYKQQYVPPMNVVYGVPPPPPPPSNGANQKQLYQHNVYLNVNQFGGNQLSQFPQQNNW